MGKIISKYLHFITNLIDHGLYYYFLPTREYALDKKISFVSLYVDNIDIKGLHKSNTYDL